MAACRPLEFPALRLLHARAQGLNRTRGWAEGRAQKTSAAGLSRRNCAGAQATAEAQLQPIWEFGCAGAQTTAEVQLQPI